jgi:tRNA(Leu) C34 or U34 (ribose-2'-O)-methylase TrmL
MDDEARQYSSPPAMAAEVTAVESVGVAAPTTVVSSNGSISKMYLIITNISKRTNVRELIKVGVAFGCEKILMVGQKSFNSNFSSGGDNDSRIDRTDDPTDIPAAVLPAFRSGAVSMERFEKWNDCVVFLQERNILLVGVEIHDDAKTIQEICQHLDCEHSARDVAFLMGNEGTGLLEKQMQTCDMFCRIPQYGSGTASLNVYVAASIILNQFHLFQRNQQTLLSNMSPSVMNESIP